LHGPATTEIDSAHLRGEHRLIAIHGSRGPIAWESAGNRLATFLGARLGAAAVTALMRRCSISMTSPVPRRSSWRRPVPGGRTFLLVSW